MRKELEDAAREGASRRSNSPVPALVELERTGSLSDLTGNAKAAGFFSDGIPKRIHLKFVRPTTKRSVFRVISKLAEWFFVNGVSFGIR